MLPAVMEDKATRPSPSQDDGCYWGHKSTTEVNRKTIVSPS